MATLHRKDYGFLIGGTLVSIYWAYDTYQSQAAGVAITILLAGVVLNTWAATNFEDYPSWSELFWVGATVVGVFTVWSSYFLGFTTVMKIYLTIAGGAYIMGFILTHATTLWDQYATRRIRKRHGL